MTEKEKMVGIERITEAMVDSPNPNPKAASLNEIIKSLCDWIYDTNIIIKHLGVYSQCGDVYLELTFVKKINMKSVALTRAFRMFGGVLGSKNWDENRNDLELAYMIEKFEACKTVPVERYGWEEENDQSN